jgi:hypothetical protein
VNTESKLNPIASVLAQHAGISGETASTLVDSLYALADTIAIQHFHKIRQYHQRQHNQLRHDNADPDPRQLELFPIEPWNLF